jgi:hypothetical protein
MKIGNFVVMVVRGVHGGKELLKVNDSILNNIPPNCPGNRFIELLSLEKVNQWVKTLLGCVQLAPLEGLIKVFTTGSCRESGKSGNSTEDRLGDSSGRRRSKRSENRGQRRV